MIKEASSFPQRKITSDVFGTLSVVFSLFSCRFILLTNTKLLTPIIPAAREAAGLDRKKKHSLPSL